MSEASKTCQQVVKHISPPVGEVVVADVVVREAHMSAASKHAVKNVATHVSS